MAVRLKHVAQVIAGQSPESSGVTSVPDGLPFLQGSAEFGKKYPVSKSFCSTPPKIAPAGSWLISVRAPVGTLNLADQSYCIGRGLAAISPRDVDHSFLGYALENAKPFLSAISTGSTFQAISTHQLENLELDLPPPEAQRQIARFLDEKTAQIDGLIDKKRALLDRLAEKRQALITRAVTKGLNPAAPMKPSGIDCLGDIPAHWEVLPLRRLARKVSTGRTPSSAGADYFTDGEINWYTPGDFGTGVELTDSVRKIVHEALEDGASTLFAAGSVLMVCVGATLGKVGVAVVPGSANQQINVIDLEPENDPYYLAYFLHALREEVRVAANGNTLPILNQDGTKSLIALRPPASEQRDIATALRGHDQREAGVLETVRRSIELLSEYRAAAITSAVTGQLEGLR
ncbi:MULTISPECIES: restriction endonuclease subunit S [unclassified Brevundimonas]